jgi:hypothetical protein
LAAKLGILEARLATDIRLFTLAASLSSLIRGTIQKSKRLMLAESLRKCQRQSEKKE